MSGRSPAESQSLLSGTLKTLLDEMDYQESVAVGFALRYGDPEYATLHSNEEAALAISDARKARAAARLALEEYVERLQDRITVSLGCNAELVAQLDEWKVELSRLRSASLTATEAEAILETNVALGPEIRGKLQSISAGRSTEYGVPK